MIKSNETVICVITGSALKQPSAIYMAAGDSKIHVKADVNELTALITELGI